MTEEETTKNTERGDYLLRKLSLPAVISTFLVCMGFWMLITWSVAAEELAAGAIVSLAVSLYSSRFFIHENAFHLFQPARFAGLVSYLVTFMGELIKANLDVAKRVYGGCRNINPGIVKIPVDLKSDYGRSMLADSITLTPGTITLDAVEEGEQCYFYVHWLDVTAESGAPAGDAIKGTLEKGVKKVFD